MILETIKIKNKRKSYLLTDIRYPENISENCPIFIFAHGFKGFKDWGCFPYMLEKIAETNVFCVSFNFSYNGIGETDLDEFTRLDLFAKNTLSRELEDLSAIIDYFDNNKENFKKYNFENLVLCGHSRGGGIAILKASVDKRVKKLITLSAVSTFHRYTEKQKEEWERKGYLEVLNTRTRQLMKMNYTFLEDLEKNRERLDIQQAVKKINCPFLIIHGTEDLSVDFSEAEELYRLSNKSTTKLIPIEKTGHTFGTVHPFLDTTPFLERVILEITNFIKG
ncbi:MAG: alpha/beta hydrolase fold domain-containing protein [Ignavibacteria bacterium]|nr:alpha/beta hydrolase fold domain-containing protein [Ignavibacteria bacterium]